MKLLAIETSSLACSVALGYADEIIARHGVLDEKPHFLRKPFSLESLAEKVRSVLAG